MLVISANSKQGHSYANLNVLIIVEMGFGDTDKVPRKFVWHADLETLWGSHKIAHEMLRLTN